MKKLLIATTAAFAMSGAAFAQSPEQVVADANKQWDQALNQGNIDKLVSFYTESATVSPGNGAVLSGHEDIRSLFGGFIENSVHNHQIRTVDVMADDKQITQLGHWQAEGVNAEGQAISFGGVLVTVLKQNAAGKWELQSHVWNAAP